MRKAIFFDRDGVVNRRIIGGYVRFPEEFIFFDDFFDFFKFIKEDGYLAILVTNQQGIGKGLMTEEQLHVVHNFMNEQLIKKMGFSFDDIYFCPELHSAGSIRRKPQPGMIIEAIEKHSINTIDSWTIGDNITDAIAGKKAGTKTILLTEDDIAESEFVDFVAPDFDEIKKIFDNILVETQLI